jgi:hypothetical protein
MRSKDKIRESLKFIIAAISIVFATYFFVLENRTIPYLIDKLRAQKFYNVFLNTMIY